MVPRSGSALNSGNQLGEGRTKDLAGDRGQGSAVAIAEDGGGNGLALRQAIDVIAVGARPDGKREAAALRHGGDSRLG